jgi:hypothetical protein
MTKINAERREATANRELTTEELDLVSGGGKTSKPKEDPLPYLIVTLETVLVS